jgi:hypothetical protein
MGSIDDRELKRRATVRAAVRDRLRTKSLDSVRAELIDNVGFNWYQLEVMREWVAEREAEADAERQRIEHRDLRDARADQHAEESLRISRSAKNASWFASAIAILALIVAAYAALRQYPLNHGPASAPSGARPAAVPKLEPGALSAEPSRPKPTAK